MLGFWYVSALSIGCMIFLLVACILLFRMNRSIKDQRQRQVTAQWLPLLEHCLSSPIEVLPRLTHPEHTVFLHLWNDFCASKSDSMAPHLIHMARQAGSDHVAKDLLHSRFLRRRILAVATLGRLRDRSVWDEISALMTHSNSFLAFQAAQALLLIDADAALPLLIPLIGRRTDWSPLKVASMLSTVGHDLASATMVQAAIQGDPLVSPRLIRHLPITQSPHGLSRLRQFLHDQSSSGDMLAASLFAFGEFRDSTDLPVIRQHLSNPAWYVRVQAATALGKMGTHDDEARLIALFSDEQWWVRYRAGEALGSLKSMTEEKLELLQETLSTPEAQEILAPVLAKFRARHARQAIQSTASRVLPTPTGG